MENGTHLEVSQRKRKDFLDAIHDFAMMNHDSYIKWHKGSVKFASEKVNRESIIQEYVKMFFENHQYQKC